MPKLKSHSGTKDRVKVTRTGKIRAGHPNTSHFLQKKSESRKRALTGLGTLSKSNARNIKKRLGV